MAELHEVEAWLDALLSQLEPAERKKMLREVAHDVRRIQQQNITAQRSPDGTAWEPRRVTVRTKPGRIRRKMFAKLKTAKYLKAQANANMAEVAFVPAVQRLARVHHFGLREKLPGNGKVIKYVPRQLIGLDKRVVDLISSRIIAWN